MNMSFVLDVVMNNTTQLFSNGSLRCFSIFRIKGADVKNVMTVIHASLIPLIISANLLSIFGIIKTKRNEFTSSQILFLTLFISDLTFGVVQIPAQIYLSWKSHDLTCFEKVVGKFCAIYPTCLSGTLLCVISVDRYIRVVHNKYYKRIVTNKSLSVTITMATLISFVWACVEALDLVKFENRYTAMSAYTGVVLAIGVFFNVALLKYVKQKTKNSSVQQTLDSSLTKTVTLILASMVSAYLPLMITLAIISCRLIYSTGRPFMRASYRALLLTLMLPQVNAILNSVIYFARNSCIKRYYYKLFNQGNERRHLTEPRFYAANRNRRCQQQELKSVSKPKHKTGMFSVDIRLSEECSYS